MTPTPPPHSNSCSADHLYYYVLKVTTLESSDPRKEVINISWLLILTDAKSSNYTLKVMTIQKKGPQTKFDFEITMVIMEITMESDTTS